jgi:hypothetical protein
VFSLVTNKPQFWNVPRKTYVTKALSDATRNFFLCQKKRAPKWVLLLHLLLLLRRKRILKDFQIGINYCIQERDFVFLQV